MKNSLRIHKWTHNEFNIFILGVLTHPLFSYMEGSVKKCTASRKVLKSPLLEAVHHIMLSVFTSLQSRL